MEESERELQERYTSLDTPQLITLYRNGALSERASTALKAVLTTRGLSSEDLQQLVTLESPQEAEISAKSVFPLLPGDSTVMPPFRYAGFWLRFSAASIDMVILLILYFLLLFLLPNTFKETTTLEGEIEKVYHPGAIATILFNLALILYKTILESSRYQATIGKYLLGLRVTNLSGERVSFRTAINRSWPTWLPNVFSGSGMFSLIISLLALISCVAVGFTEFKQGFHDKLAKCLVVKRGT